MSPKRQFAPGDKFAARYPFVRVEYEALGEEGPHTESSWKPGVDYEALPPYGEDSEAVADGEGQVLLEVVDVLKPGRYPTRVFFIRRWRRPDGREFGKTALRITTQDAFRRLTNGWRGGEYRLRATGEPT